MTSRRTPAAIARRVEDLEQAAGAAKRAANGKVPGRVAQAIDAIFSALEALYPKEPWGPGSYGRGSHTLIDEAAERLLAGTMPESELAALHQALPAEARAVFGLTPEQALHGFSSLGRPARP